MKLHLKKLLSMLLALTLVLTACGGNDKDKDSGSSDTGSGDLKGEISVQTEKGWKSYYENAAKKITDENPDVTINFIETPSMDHLDVLDSTDASNSDVADLFAIPSDRFTALSENDVLGTLPAKDIADELGGYDNFDEQLGGAFKVGDEYLAYPMNIETLVTFVNTKNAEKAGIDHTKPFELNDVSDPATVLLPLFNTWFGVAPNIAGNLTLLEINDDKFESTYTKEYEELSDEQKSVFDSIYKYWKMHKDANTGLFDKETGWGYIDNQFAENGNGIIRLEGPWATSGEGIIANEIAAGNIEIYPVDHITVAGKPLRHWQGGWALVVNSRIEADKDKMAIAEALIKELVNPENAVELYKATGKILENAPIEKYTESDLSDTDKKLIEKVLESFKISKSRPLFKEYGQVWSTWENAFLSWNSVNPQSPKDAYKEIKASFDAMMQQIQH